MSPRRNPDWSLRALSGPVLAFAGMALASSPCPAQPAPAAAATVTAPAQSGGAAAAPISMLYDRLQQIERIKGSFAQRAQLLAPAVDATINLQTVLQNSLGLRYRTLPDSQKQQLLQQFRQFTIARYVSNFGSGGSDTFKIDPVVTAAPIPGEQIVHTQILSGGASTTVNYVMRQGSAGWQAVDVLLNGNISQVAVQRADFDSGLTSGDATPLIDSLKKKTQAFSES